MAGPVAIYVRRCRCPWTAAVVALSVLATAAALWWGEGARALAAGLVADSHAIEHGQCWRLLSGPLVHTTAYHLTWDLGILAVLGFLYEPRMRRTWPPLVLVGMTAPVAAVFIAQPEISYYYGTSGLTHAMMAAVVVYERLDGRHRSLALLAGVGLAGKIVWGFVGPGALIEVELTARVREVPIAHLVGVLVGVAAALGARRQRVITLSALSSSARMSSMPPTRPTRICSRIPN